MVKVINDVCDLFFNYLGFGAHTQYYQFQLFLCLLNVALSAWPLMCYALYTSDVHIVFWIGEIPQYVNLMVPLCLVTLNIGVNYFSLVKSSASSARIGCFMLFVTIGALMLGMGLYVAMIATESSAELTEQCGKTPLTAKVEGEWQRLNKFYEECDPKRKKVVTQCPGFSKEFPNRVFVNYLESLEYEYDCVGFCKFWAKPIFNEGAEMGNRCASAIGEHVGTIEFTVGTPTAMVGAGLLYIGLMLAGYDHL
jgi:hypothetical protein